jgi:hypothetical protein
LHEPWALGGRNASVAEEVQARRIQNSEAKAGPIPESFEKSTPPPPEE